MSNKPSLEVADPQLFSLLPESAGKRELTDARAIAEHICICYDVCNELIDSGRFAEAIGSLACGLARIRSRSDPREWQVAARTSRSHPTHRRLLEDPYMWGAFHKPRGYAGDADTLDFLYGFRDAGISVTPLGRELLNVSTAVPIARAVRSRCAYIAQAIHEIATRSAKATIVSVGCGHMRELHRLSAVDADRTEVFGIDHDFQTLDTLTGLHPGCRLQTIPGSVRSILAAKVQIPKADLIYVSGLYDYLGDELALALTRTLINRLTHDGTLMILNLANGNTEIACMEAAWDWWLFYRDTRALDAIANALCVPHLEAITTDVVPERVSCLTLHTTGPRN